LHRIDPLRLGLPSPISVSRGRRQFSHTVDSAGELVTSDNEVVLCCSEKCPVPCPRQQLLEAWPYPSYCVPCHVIDAYYSNNNQQQQTTLYCQRCGIQATLWVCLTCGSLGCGRYSNKHAEEHYHVTGHAFCLELSTLRIWDYSSATGEFVHRMDVLECSASPVLLQQQQRRGHWASSSYAARTTTVATVTASLSATDNDAVGLSWSNGATQDDNCDDQNRYYGNHVEDDDTTSPKKATMIGEEYEALLQSALEEQAQHYEGEMTRLRAQWTASLVHPSDLSVAEQNEIQELQRVLEQLRSQLDVSSRQLLELQSQEAGLRAASQRLLREQQTLQETLRRVRAETVREQTAGQSQVEDLEQQIADLTANQRMRRQISQDQELQNAHIFGTTTTDTAYKKKNGKKSRRNRK